MLFYAYASAIITARLQYCFPVCIPLVFDNFNYLTFPARRKRLLVIRNTIRRAVIAAGTRFCPYPDATCVIASVNRVVRYTLGS